MTAHSASEFLRFFTGKKSDVCSVHVYNYNARTIRMLRALWSYTAVRVKGGKSLRNGMWHGVRNGIIMRNTIYAGNKLTEERIPFSHQFYKSNSFLDVADY